MRTFFYILSSFIVTLCASLAGEAAKPNVVIILADDSGWGDYSENGNANLQTPHIDSIARDGVKLDRFYVCPVCSPTRAEFLTGRYHPRSGVRGVSTGQERLNTDVKTIADSFKAAGYATGAFGKWHNGSQWPYHPNARGFDEYYGFTSGHWGEYFDTPLEHNGRPVRGKGFISADLANHAIEFIETNKDNPFFCYIPFNTPHSPFCVPDEYWNRFKDSSVSMRALNANPEVLDETRCVLAMMENLDWNVGRILQRLDELKLRDNTIVVYFSDNGPNTWRWNGGMKGKKGQTDEGGVRSTFFISWPAKLPKGHLVKEISGAIDILPTLASLSGVKHVGDKALDGRDLSLLLTNQNGIWPGRTIFSTWGGNVSARTQQYRLDNAGELFDMIADPGQTKPVTAEKPEVAARLAGEVAAWRKEMFGDATPKVKGKGKGKGKGGEGDAHDARPYPVGYAEFPRTTLPARDGVPHGSVKRSAGAPNCSYFVNWKSQEDSMTWNINVHTTGDYAVEILYACPVEDAGSEIELSFNDGDSSIKGKVTPGWFPPLIDNQDRVPRKSESYMREFHPLSLGTMHLTKGTGQLLLRALQIPGKTVMEVRSVVLTLKAL